MVCDDCGAKIRDEEFYYKTGDENLCDNCIDEYLMNLKDEMQKYLPTKEEVEAEEIIDERYEKR